MPGERGSKASGRLTGDASGEPNGVVDALPAYRSGLDTLKTDFTEAAAEEAELSEYDASLETDTEVTGPPPGSPEELLDFSGGPRTPAWDAQLPRRSMNEVRRPWRPSGSVFGIAVGFALLLGSVVGAVISGGIRRAPAPVENSAATPGSITGSPSSVVERARRGELDAVASLEAKPPLERAAADTLAVAEGRRENKLRSLELLTREIEGHPEALRDPKRLRRLRDFLVDRDTTLLAAPLIAGLPGSVGPDVLYAVWVSTRERTETTMLAESLVYSRDLREKASPALAVALDLRLAKTCEEYRAVLPRATEHGDRRSVHLLSELTRRTGCGARGSDDCFACLRSPEADPQSPLTLAIAAAGKRPGPEL